tara:strand:+ start:1050 stop:1280 length:231 start_codon:yes stop_codon:yes gene_type:complete
MARKRIAKNAKSKDVRVTKNKPTKKELKNPVEVVVKNNIDSEEKEIAKMHVVMEKDSVQRVYVKPKFNYLKAQGVK